MRACFYTVGYSVLDPRSFPGSYVVGEVFVILGSLDIFNGVVVDIVQVVLGEFADDFSGNAYEKAAVRHYLTFHDQGAGRDYAVLSDLASVEERRVESDDTVVADGCSVDDRAVTY